ncbi:MAG: IS3 family transposase, partial [Nocardioidaceae bacterium]
MHAELTLGMGLDVNHKRVARLMRGAGVQGLYRRRRARGCTVRDPDAQVMAVFTLAELEVLVSIPTELAVPGRLYGYFGRLRREDPVHWNERHRSWLVTRYADVDACFRDRRLSSDRVVPH